jgi:hypothetical protein
MSNVFTSCSHATQRFSEVAGKCTRWNFYRKLKLFLKRICTCIIFTFHVLRPGEFWDYWFKSHLHHDCWWELLSPLIQCVSFFRRGLPANKIRTLSVNPRYVWKKMFRIKTQAVLQVSSFSEYVPSTNQVRICNTYISLRIFGMCHSESLV